MALFNCEKKALFYLLITFIHKQVDLPYIFESSPDNKRLESMRFVAAAKFLISDILKEKNNFSILRPIKSIKGINKTPRFTL